MPSPLKNQLLEIQQGEPIGLEALGYLENALGEWLGQATQTLIHQWGGDPSHITAIGSHGQTVGHFPHQQITWQLGNPALIAALTKCPVVSHFRHGDLALKGQGAPLVPWAEALLWSDPHQPQLLLNIGGIANVTYLPSQQEYPIPVCQWPVLAMDTGPGNVWIDAACQQYLNKPLDEEGRHAALGQLYEPFLQDLFQEAAIEVFLSAPFPKSTGRDLFTQQRLVKLIQPYLTTLSPESIIATLTHFTAQTITLGLQRLLEKNAPSAPISCWVSGGGAFNNTLIQLLQKALNESSIPVCINTDLPFLSHPQHKEPLIFALLAWARWHHLAANMPHATGASQATPLGAVWLPPA
ncbi:MAG: anhydro-N-acetylmuramic acid kinase [Vampirovibrionales bacterium]